MIRIIKILIALVMVCQLFSCGLVAKNGLVKEGENTYYYLNDKKQTGWQEIDGDWYYFFNGNYTMAHNTMIVDFNGKEYFLDYNGKMCKNEVKTIESFKYRIDKEGTPVALGAIKATAYFGEDGAMLKNTQKDWGGKMYIIDENGIAKQQPDYQLVFNCTFPKTFKTGSYNSWVGDLVIEDITYEYDSKEEGFKIFWTATAGNSWNGPHHSCSRTVDYKVYDPEGYVIESFWFSTTDLKMEEKYKGTEFIASGDVTKKGIYKIELLDGYYK